MKVKVGELKAVGSNCYQDSYGRTLFVDGFTKKQYLVEKGNEKRYQIFSQRIMFSLLVVVFIGWIFDKWVYGILGGVATFAFFEFFYRKKFLPSLQEVEVVLPKKATMIDSAREQSNADNIIRMCGGIALFVLIWIYTVLKLNEEGINFNNVLLIILSIGITIFSIYVTVCCVKVLLERKGEKK